MKCCDRVTLQYLLSMPFRHAICTEKHESFLPSFRWQKLFTWKCRIYIYIYYVVKAEKQS